MHGALRAASHPHAARGGTPTKPQHSKASASDMQTPCVPSLPPFAPHLPACPPAPRPHHLPPRPSAAPVDVARLAQELFGDDAEDNTLADNLVTDNGPPRAFSPYLPHLRGVGQCAVAPETLPMMFYLPGRGEAWGYQRVSSPWRCVLCIGGAVTRQHLALLRTVLTPHLPTAACRHRRDGPGCAPAVPAPDGCL